MKLLALAILLVTSFGVKAQIKTTTITNADGSKSPSFSLALGKGKPSTTVSPNSTFSFFYPNGMLPEQIIPKEGADNKTYILVANESDANLAKFEIAIFSGNKTLSKATLLIRLSANSFTTKLLGNGKYIFSNKSPAERLKYDFSGTVKLGSADVTISDGWFTVERTKNQIELKYELTLVNGVKTTGQYNTEYQTEDRSRQTAQK
ncbi:hypothetical protein ACVWYN_003364 [Pedobacter sp. UYP24]